MPRTAFTSECGLAIPRRPRRRINHPTMRTMMFIHLESRPRAAIDYFFATFSLQFQSPVSSRPKTGFKDQFRNAATRVAALDARHAHCRKDIDLSPSGPPRRGSSLRKLKDFAPPFQRCDHLRCPRCALGRSDPALPLGKPDARCGCTDHHRTAQRKPIYRTA